MHQLRPALVMMALMTVLTGVVYPVVVTGVAQLLFPARANGSLITRDGTVVGSSLIGQQFTAPRYFWGRLSATTRFAYDAAASSGSNYGPLSGDMLQAVQARIDALRVADPGNTAPVPVDLVTSSGSGLDPQISPAGAAFQVARVAKARGLDAATVAALVASHTEARQLGCLGEPRVDVLALNLALDAAPVR
jgi:K+-transporting ATPase ATPase C chain